MANVLAELFQNTANAIREKTGETGSMKPAEFPEKIRSIQTGGTGNAEADVRPLIVTENGIYYPTENVEIGKTFTFKDSYAQEELQTLFNASSTKDETEALLLNSDTVGFAVAQDSGFYALAVMSDDVMKYWVPEEFAATGYVSKGGWYSVEGMTFTPLESVPSVTIPDEIQLCVDTIRQLNPLFVLEAYDGFSVVGVNVSTSVEGGGQPQLYAPSIVRNGETLTISNPSHNGIFVQSYKIYDNGILVSEQGSKTYSLSDLTFGTHIFEVSSGASKFRDSEKSNAVNASKYSITLHLTNVNTTFSKTYVLHGDPLTITFTLPSVYYTMPETITATMGGSVEGIVYGKDDRKITVEAVTGDIEIAITSKEVKLLNDLSWDTITAYAANGTLEQQFSIGDTKNIDIRTNDTTVVTIPFAIAAFHHDILADGSGTANVTFVAKKGFRTGSAFSQMQWKTWNNTPQRTQFQAGGIIYDNLPQVLKDSLKTVTKKQSASTYVGNKELQTTEDQLFWLSLTEVGLSDPDCYTIEGTPYPIFTDDNSRKRNYVVTSAYFKYPLRDKKDISGGTAFAGVNASGGLGEWRTGDYSGDYLNILGFCL